MCLVSLSRIGAVGSAVICGFALGAEAATISLRVHAQSLSGNPLDRLVPGDQVLFQVGVAVDDGLDSLHPGNRGLATLVYDVVSPQAIAEYLLLPTMQDSFSGYNWQAVASVNSEPFFQANASTAQTFYGGGWGFDRGGLPGGGDTTSTPGKIIGAMSAAPQTWNADVEGFPGSQPYVRLGVGIGDFFFPPEDPVLGRPIPNCGIIGCPPGDGTWVIQDGVIDTTGWSARTYSFDLIPTAAAVFDGTLDYGRDMPGGFRVDVASDMAGTAFSFTLIPSRERRACCSSAA